MRGRMLGVCVFLGMLGCSGEDTDEEESVRPQTIGCRTVLYQTEVSVTDQGIEPREATVQVGRIIRWINESSDTVRLRSGTPTAPFPVFDSGRMAVGDDFCLRFDGVWSGNYFNERKTTLQGTLTVVTSLEE